MAAGPFPFGCPPLKEAGGFGSPRRGSREECCGVQRRQRAGSCCYLIFFRIVIFLASGGWLCGFGVLLRFRHTLLLHSIQEALAGVTVAFAQVPSPCCGGSGGGRDRERCESMRLIVTAPSPSQVGESVAFAFIAGVPPLQGTIARGLFAVVHRLCVCVCVGRFQSM